MVYTVRRLLKSRPHVYSLLAIVMFVVLPARAHTSTDIVIHSLWAEACPDTADTLLLRMTIDNREATHPIALSGATGLYVAQAQTLNSVENCEGAAAEGIVIPTGEQLDFGAAGYAVALEMVDDYEMSDPFSLTLTFDMLDADLNVDGDPVELIVGVPVLEAAPEQGDLRVTMPWARPTAFGGMDIGDHGDDADHEDDHEMAMSAPMFPSAAFLSLRNTGETPLRLIAASSPVAAVVEIHETQMQDDVMRMGQIDGLDLSPGEIVTFEPGGYHIMLIELVRDLVEGEAILLTLTFESGEEITIAVPVYDATASAMETEHEHGDHSH